MGRPIGAVPYDRRRYMRACMHKRQNCKRHYKTKSDVVSEAALADMQRRAALRSAQDLTGRLMGDPVR